MNVWNIEISLSIYTAACWTVHLRCKYVYVYAMIMVMLSHSGQAQGGHLAGQLSITGLMFGLPKEGDHLSVCGFAGCLLWLGCLSKDRVTGLLSQEGSGSQVG